MPPKPNISAMFQKSKKYELKHINNINYSGFHPLDKKKTIKKVNEFIDKFNKCHNDLYFDKALTQCSELTNDPAIEKLIQDNKLDKQTQAIYTAQIQEAIHDVQTLSINLYKNRYKDMKKKLKSIIDPKSKDKKLTISKINQEIDKLTKALKEYEKEQLDEQTVRIKQEVKDRLTLLINKINTFMHQKHEHKRAELLKHLEKLKTYNVSKEAECLRALRKVLEGSKKNLNSDTINLFNNTSDDGFPQNIGVTESFRNWKPFDNNQNYILKAPKGIKDKKTRHVILNFYGVITDNGDCNKLEKAIWLINKQLDDHAEWNEELSEQLKRLDPRNKSQNALYLKELLNVIEDKNNKLSDGAIKFFNDLGGFKTWKPYDDKNEYHLYIPSGIFDKETRHVILNFYKIISNDADRKSLDKLIDLINKPINEQVECAKKLPKELMQLTKLDSKNRSQSILYIKELLEVIENNSGKLSNKALEFFNKFEGFKTWKQYDDKNEYQLYEPSGIEDKETRHVILNFYKIIANDADHKSLDRLIDLIKKQITTQILKEQASLTQKSQQMNLIKQLSMLESDNNAVEAKYLKELKDAVENSKTLSQDAKRFFNNEFSKKTYKFHTWKPYDDKNEYHLYIPSGIFDKETRHIILNFYKIISDKEDSNGLKSIIKQLNKHKNSDSEK